MPSGNPTHPPSTNRRIWLFRFLAVGLILVLLPFILQNFHPLPQDFIAYWASGRLHLAGGNPYSPDQMLLLQQANGWTLDLPLMVWYPPWAMPLFLPFGTLPFAAGWLIWFCLCLGLILFCADRLWRLYRGSLHLRWLAWLTAVFCSYTLFNLVFTQASPFILFGVVLFMAQIQYPLLEASQNEKTPRQPVWNLVLLGISLVLISIKPQALYLFWPAAGLWALTRKRWNVIAAGGAAFLAAAALSTVFNPEIWGNYLHLLNEFPPDFWATPTIGFLLREIFSLDQFWVQFPGLLLGLAWLAWRWKQAGRNWSWQDEMPVLIAVSLITAAHAWTHDQILLLPAQMQVTARLVNKGYPPGTALLVAAWALVNIASIVLHFWVSDAWFFWQAPVFLGLYWYGMRITSTESD